MYYSVDLEYILGTYWGYGKVELWCSKNWHLLACWEMGGELQKIGARLRFSQTYAWNSPKFQYYTSTLPTLHSRCLNSCRQLSRRRRCWIFLFKWVNERFEKVWLVSLPRENFLWVIDKVDNKSTKNNNLVSLLWMGICPRLYPLLKKHVY